MTTNSAAAALCRFPPHFIWLPPWEGKLSPLVTDEGERVVIDRCIEVQ